MEGYYIIIEPVVMLRGAPSNGYGQVKLRFSGESRSGMTDWLPIVCDYAGKDYGFWAEPEAGTLAVALMQPESNRGFVLGFLYDKEHRPPVREGEPAKDRIILQTEKHRFEMIDEGDKERIELIGMDGKMSVVLGADGSIKIDNDIEDGTVLINAGKKLTLEANELLLGGKEETNGKAEDIKGKAKDIKLEATAAACIDGGKKVCVTGKNIYLDGTTGVTAKGKQVAKQGDTVVGVDTHIVMFPSINGEIPTPMPLPFIGTLKDGLSNNVRIGKDSKKKVAVENSIAQHTTGHIAPLPAVGFQQPPDNQGKVTRGTEPSVKVNKKEVAVVGSKVSSCDDTNAPNRSSVVTAGMAKPAIEAKVGEVTYKWNWKKGKWSENKNVMESVEKKDLLNEAEKDRLYAKLVRNPHYRNMSRAAFDSDLAAGKLEGAYSVAIFNNPKYEKAEYERQLLNQENGINKLTIDEYLENRRVYEDKGRGNSKTQEEARKDAIKKRISENRKKGMKEEEAKAEANEWISGKAALHDPDQKAGGYAENVTGLGDEGVNSSIGAQWNRKKNIKKMDENANCLKETLPPEELKSTTMVTILIIRS